METDSYERFLEWEIRQTFVLLRNSEGEEILFLRTPVGHTWYRQSRSKRENPRGPTTLSIGLHDPAFALQTGNLQSELALYARRGFQRASSATKRTTNSRPRPNNNQKRRF